MKKGLSLITVVVINLAAIPLVIIGGVLLGMLLDIFLHNKGDMGNGIAAFFAMFFIPALFSAGFGAVMLIGKVLSDIYQQQTTKKIQTVNAIVFFLAASAATIKNYIDLTKV